MQHIMPLCLMTWGARLRRTAISSFIWDLVTQLKTFSSNYSSRMITPVKKSSSNLKRLKSTYSDATLCQTTSFLHSTGTTCLSTMLILSVSTKYFGQNKSKYLSITLYPWASQQVWTGLKNQGWSAALISIQMMSRKLRQNQLMKSA